MPPESLLELKRECHRLIEVIATRPGRIKLLLGARQMLTTFAAYKMNRDFSQRKHNATVQQTDRIEIEPIDRWSD